MISRLSLTKTIKFGLSLALLISGAMTSNAQEMTTYISPFKVDETVERFKSVLEKHDLILFDVIDHQAAAAEIGETIRPTVVIIFENARIGTEWTQCEQTVAIDLPFKVLVWEDEGGDTYLSYTNPRLIAKRHSVKDCPQLTDDINKVLVRVINETIKEY